MIIRRKLVKKNGVELIDSRIFFYEVGLQGLEIRKKHLKNYLLSLFRIRTIPVASDDRKERIDLLPQFCDKQQLSFEDFKEVSENLMQSQGMPEPEIKKQLDGMRQKFEAYQRQKQIEDGDAKGWE